MFRKLAAAASALALVASLGLASTSASAGPIKKIFPPHPHHFHGGWGGPLALFGAAALIGATVAAEQPSCSVVQQAVDGPDGPYIRNVSVCN